MHKVAIAMIFVGLIGACKKTNWDKVTSDMEDLRDKLCGCTDKQCVEDTETKMKALNASVKGERGRPDDLDKIFNGMHECEDKVAKRGVVPAMTKLRDIMCTCKDPSCAKVMGDEIKMRMSTDFAHAEPTPDETKQLAEISKQTADCMTRAMAGSDAATTPTAK
jgi:hypothetical protein